MFYEYECRECLNCFSIICSHGKRNDQECPRCKSKNIIKLIGSLIPLGTRDGFGIKNEFTDHLTGKPIDNWRSWEKAGYRNPLDTTKNRIVKEKIKEKIKIKKGA